MRDIKIRHKLHLCKLCDQCGIIFLYSMMLLVALLMYKAETVDEITSIIRNSFEEDCMRAHAVILGAGATIVTFPYGDRLRRKSSVTNSLIEKHHFKGDLT